ncbi:MAG: hypothetical protein U0670_07140 [Anaerolineae bacterium]
MHKQGMKSNHNRTGWRRIALLGALGAALISAACGSLAGTPEPTIPPPPMAITPVPTVAPPPTDTPISAPPFPVEWTDENAVFNGLCFESVWDAAGQVFVLKSAEDLTGLFDLADNSHLCRHPIERGTFDFSGGRVLVGTWSRGHGCAARHDFIRTERDDIALLYAINVRLVVEGTCDYELIRPFWIGISGVYDYDIRLRVE